MTARKLVLKGDPARPQRRALKLVSRDTTLGLAAGNGSEDDPVVEGGWLRLRLNDGAAYDETFAVAARHWRYLRKPGANRGYKGKKASPVKTIVVKPGKLLKAVVKGEALGFSLASEPTVVDVVVGIGAHRYCVRFESATTFQPDRKYVAKNAGAPSSCP